MTAHKWPQQVLPLLDSNEVKHELQDLVEGFSFFFFLASTNLSRTLNRLADQSRLPFLHPPLPSCPQSSNCHHTIHAALPALSAITLNLNPPGLIAAPWHVQSASMQSKRLSRICRMCNMEGRKGRQVSSARSQAKGSEGKPICSSSRDSCSAACLRLLEARDTCMMHTRKQVQLWSSALRL